MDGENNGSNPIKMDDLGGKTPPIFGNTLVCPYLFVHIIYAYHKLLSFVYRLC